MKKEIIKDEIVKKIIKVLKKYFEDDCISCYEKDKIIACPLGTFIKEKSKWTFSVDLSSYADNYIGCNINCILHIMKDLSKNNINIDFYTGYYNVFDEETLLCCGSIFEEEVYAYLNKEDLGDDHYYDALDILSKKLIEEYRLESSIENTKIN